MSEMSEGINSIGKISVNGARLHYAIEGSGFPVLVIGSALYYPRTFSHYLRNSCRMVFIDVRHFAETDNAVSSDKITLDTYMEDIERIRAHLKINHAIVIGHSHHGNLALEYAKRFPERVSHLVLIGSPPLEVKAIQKAAEAYWENHASVERKTLHQEKLNALCSDRFDNLSPEQDYVAQYVAESPKYWYDASYDAAHLWRDVPINMETIKVFRDFFVGGYNVCWDPVVMRAPVLVVMGLYDYAVPHILWDDVRPKLENLTFHLFEHSGHTPQLEEPAHFDRTLLEWLANFA